MQLTIISSVLTFRSLPVAVVVILVIASQSREAAQADGVGEEDLSSSIHPYLRTEQKVFYVERGFIASVFKLLVIDNVATCEGKQCSEHITEN